ncbi:MAG TPA: hypothetical protein VF892_03355 [Pseudonocardiaceae bacterium]
MATTVELAFDNRVGRPGLSALGHPVPAIIGGVVAIAAALLARRYAPEP